ncbi:hypothetical protein B0J13DRAFT_523826 [Dactylonectria estremocensis]|uniref:Uncharacterized protein n=1 Tax=Dactylonectria estremocensis TaxID=1079267 RepID=A0A9P9J5Q2_9HYPO|nr:hypothetical protein B0J13DRAFT_523826 [Dactylonectria estremocensis]
MFPLPSPFPVTAALCELYCTAPSSNHLTSPSQMNWTEGALARHSRRKGWDKDAARQKQYFAKARARKYEATSRRSPRASSFIPDYIPQGPHAQDKQPSPSSTRHKQTSSRKRLLVSVREGYRDMLAPISGWPASSELQEARLDVVHQQGEPSSKQGNSDIDIESKRRKLLEKNDWTGIRFQKPIVVDFSRQGAGACRPAPQECDSRPMKRQRVSRLPQKAEDKRSGNERQDEAGHDINILIGDQRLRWSRTGNSVRSPKSQLEPLPTFESWASQQEGANTHNMHTRPSSSATLPRQPLSDVENVFGTASLNSEFQDPRMSSAYETTHFPHRSTVRERERTPDQPQYVVASLPQILYQPQPTRGRRLSLFDIRSPDPEDTGSMAVQIGVRDNEARRITAEDFYWNDWLNNNDSIGVPDAHEDTRTTSITPGISHCWNEPEKLPVPGSDCTTNNSMNLTVEDVVALPPFTCSSTPIFPSDSVDFATEDPGQNHPAPSRKHSPELDELDELDGETSYISVESLDCGGSEGPVKVDHDLVLPSKTELPRAPNVQDLLDLLMEDEQGLLKETDNLEITAGDEEEVWKRFVLDENCAELSRKAGLEAHRQTTHDLCVAMAHPASNVAEPSSATRESPSQASYQGRGLTIGLAMSSPDIASGVQEQPSFNAASTNTTDTANSTAARAGSPKSNHSDIRFHQPRLFIGRLASLPSASNAGPVQLQPPMRRRARSRKRRGDGRPDFRAMPDYDGDPIEECCEGR